MKSKKKGAQAPVDVSRAVADGARHFTMTVPGFVKFARHDGLTVWGDAIPNGLRFRQFMLDRGVDPATITEQHVKEAAAVERQRDRERDDRWAGRKREVMKILNEDAKRLLVETGIKNAGSYDGERLLSKLLAYDQLEKKAHERVTSIGMKKLQGELLAALESGDALEVIDAPEVRKKVEKPQFISKKDLPEGRKVKSSVSARGVGIKAFIIGLFDGTSPKNLLTREEAEKKALKRFPDRDRKALKGTVAYYIPGYLRRSGFDIQETPSGYWLKKGAK